MNAQEFVVAATAHLNRPLKNFRTGVRADNGGYWARYGAAASAAHYICCGIYRDDAERRARIEDTDGTGWAVLVDDVGTKGAVPAHWPQPTWITETSPGNFQHVYVLREPEPREQVIALARAFARASGCDAASATCPRWMRLPFRPSPKRPDFTTRLVSFTPTLLYSVAALASLARVELEATRGAPVKALTPEEIERVSGAFKPVLEAFSQRRMVRSTRGRIVDVVCPWMHEHGERPNTGAVLLLPTEAQPFGGFRCHHGSCADRRLKEVRLWLAAEDAHDTIKELKATR